MKLFNKQPSAFTALGNQINLLTKFLNNMKVLFKFSFLLLVLGLSFTACKKTAKGVDAKTTEAANSAAAAATSDKMYTITDGQINWTATKVGGQHMGTVKVSGGEIAASNGKISAGTVNLDMTSIAVTDIKADEGKEKLEVHLKSSDFFDVGAHPTGTFKVSSVSNSGASSSITGDLTIKGISKSVTIPANVVMAGNKISVVTPPFKINRTDWDVKYGSGIINTAKDKIIHDEISLVLDLQGMAK